jgi:hypothetical protein
VLEPRLFRGILLGRSPAIPSPGLLSQDPEGRAGAVWAVRRNPCGPPWARTAGSASPKPRGSAARARPRPRPRPPAPCRGPPEVSAPGGRYCKSQLPAPGSAGPSGEGLLGPLLLRALIATNEALGSAGFRDCVTVTLHKIVPIFQLARRLRRTPAS